MDLPFRGRDLLQPNDNEPVQLKAGLDFGTTFTSGVLCCRTHSTKWLPAPTPRAFQMYQGAPGILKNQPNTEVPSCVRYEQGRISTGHDAESRDENDWESAVETIRWLKVGLDDQPALENMREKVLQSLPSGMPIDSVIEDFLSEIFASWRLEIEDLEFPPDAIIELNCAVPAAWKTTKSRLRFSMAILAAGKRARLNIHPNIRFWPEPIAAAAYMLQKAWNLKRDLKVNDIVAVCDAGGGTTDITLLRVLKVDPPEFKELATDGIPYGSENLDQNFEVQIDTRIRMAAECNPDWEPPSNDAIKHVLKVFKTREKREFDGNQGHFRIRLQGLPADPQRRFEKDRIDNRSEDLRAIFDPVLDKIWSLLRRMLEVQSLEEAFVKELLLVGGFSGNKYLQKFLTEKLHSWTIEHRKPKIKLCPITNPVIMPSLRAAFTALQKKSTGSIAPINAALAYLNNKDGRKGDRVIQPNGLILILSLENIWSATAWSSLAKGWGHDVADTEPVELLRSFHPDQNIVPIEVKLYSVDNDGEDNYPLDHPKNNGYQLWVIVNFEVDVSSFKDKLVTWTEDNPQPGFARIKSRIKSTDGSNGGPRQSERVRKLTEKQRLLQGQQSRKITGQGKGKAPLLPLVSEQVDLPSTVHESGKTELAHTQDDGYLQWKTLSFFFSMRHEDGMQTHYILECPMAPPGERKTEGVASLTWMHETGTC
ncbi:uncharacterized protein A1O9_13073 [Exophiala aquamarina CBS 119918]|uniref:Uncharacterized protein n=1 Tax=Exophiala aquamarina CBS 119918 TaxID=1182545 RepID=A0A072NU36_9EURO|nr:uncharacterized protein A1O9_13073 [Exophiala aquamarina CBS 119918]KEF50877.1 hypothetical protein A1O9_13073 [Exophiala aquamarina CBS 119918]